MKRRLSSWTKIVRAVIGVVFLTALLTGIGMLPSAYAASFVVNSTADAVDDNPGNGVCHTAAGTCTLRAAVMEANRLAGDDTIILPAGTYNLTIAGTNEDAAATGDLDILDNLTITGAGAASTIIDGGGLDRVFFIPSSTGQVTISGVTIRNGQPPASQNGGAIWSITKLTLDGVVISGSTAAGTGVGGGVCSGCGGGGAASLVLKNSTLRGNTADRGGAIFSNVPLNIMNSTLSGNSARAGGAIVAYGTGTLTNVTIAGNTVTVATNTGGIIVEGTLTLKNSIIANNTDGNCSGNGTLTDGGSNLRYPGSDTTCVGTVGDPKLGILMDNGGQTPTMALSSASAAINAGDSAACNAPAAAPDFGAGAKDQRGYDRRSGYCDIGAYEAQPASLTIAGGSPQSAIINSPFTTALQVHVQDGNGNGLGGSAVTFAAPAAGASAILSSGTATTNNSGNASVTATANATGGGPYQVTAAATGAGQAQFALTNNPASTTATVSPSANPLVVAQSVTFTADVNSAQGTPTGTVTFKDGAATLGTGTLNGSGRATFSTAALTVGSHSITAAYAGDGNFATSDSPSVTVVVTKASATTTITGHSPNPSRPGQAVTVTFAVMGGVAPSGSVTVSDGSVSCTASLAAGSCVLSPETVGNKTLTATYSGDGNNSSSSATISHTVRDSAWQLYLPILMSGTR